MRYNRWRVAALVAASVATVAGTKPASAQSNDLYARYTSPGQCRQAAARLLRLYWRDKRSDTVLYAPLTDSVPASVAESARECAARFTVTGVPASELRHLAQLYLWSRQDTLARAAIDRALQPAASVSEEDRLWTLSLWIGALFDARPTRIVMARDYLARLDGFGARAALLRMNAHTQYANYAFSLNDRATAQAEARAALRASHELSANDRIDWVRRIEGAYLALAAPVALERNGPAALAVLDTMLADLTPLRIEGSPDQRRLVAGLKGDRERFTSLGKSGLPPVQGNVWRGTKDGATVYPRPGKVTLLVQFYGASYTMLATLNRLHAKYGARGLDIVFMTSTGGYFRNLPMPDAAVEADSMGSYVQNFLKLPVTLATEITQFSHIPDGRRQDEETANQKAYGHLGGYIMLDRKGVVRWVGAIEPSEEMVWDYVIRRSL